MKSGIHYTGLSRERNALPTLLKEHECWDHREGRTRNTLRSMVIQKNGIHGLLNELLKEHESRAHK
jgi:hypothetical protein